MVVSINYQKRRNQELFKALENPELTFLSNIQNYIPIYTKFFSLNETNYNSINLNHKWYISNVRERLDDDFHIYNCTLKNINNSTKSKPKDVFFKMAPLIDPFKYLVGKYSPDDKKLYNLPQLTTSEDETTSKFLDVNNAAYVDSFFTFLTSQLIYDFDFAHGIDFFGSFLAIKNDFKLNIIDDLDYLNGSEYFIKNKNVLFTVDDYEYLFSDDGEVNSNNGKLKPINIDHTISMKSHLSIDSFNDGDFDNIFSENNTLTKDNLREHEMELVDITNNNELLSTSNLNGNDNKTTLKSGSSCSSRTSHTSIEDECEIISDNIEEIPDLITVEDIKSEKSFNSNKKVSDNSELEVECDEDIDSNEEDEDEQDEEDDFEDECVNAIIPKVPVQVICMECCGDTFDNLILSSTLSEEEWFAAFMQIIMILITYQKMFSFTHNDLHTNNIMYVETNSKYFYYCYKNKYYKVPTFGRLFKIIDFGRAIYKYNGKLFCSDSFQAGGDAATQYNTEPYFNDKKPRLEPNFSFDLCRLACSIFDYVVEDFDSLKEITESDPVVKLIVEWCLDDKGVNLLYKNNGVERYPDFKLYKMIARYVHNHTPQAQLERPEFNNFLVNKKDIESNKKILNIDDLPVLV